LKPRGLFVNLGKPRNGGAESAAPMTTGTFHPAHTFRAPVSFVPEILKSASNTDKPHLIFL
jgi:hypothetical protein